MVNRIPSSIVVASQMLVQPSKYLTSVVLSNHPNSSYTFRGTPWSITINFYNSIWWTPSRTPFSVETRCPCCGFDTKVLFILWSHQSGYRIRVQVLPFKITLASFLPYILTCETINTDLSLCQFLSFPGSTRRSIINSIFDRTFWH